jgi:uncharacterized membrane protein YphA (DoxX/SURF4 family)
MGWLTIFVEIVGGLAVFLGALVTLASIPMAIPILRSGVSVESAQRLDHPCKSCRPSIARLPADPYMLPC